METFSALLTICVGNSPVRGEFPIQRPVTRRFDVFFDLHPNKRLSKQWWGWWFEKSSCPWWHHCNEYTVFTCCVCISYRWMLPIFVRFTSLELELYDCPSASEAIWRIWIIVSHGHLKVHCKTTTHKAQETCVHICRTAFGITGPLWGELTGHRWPPHKWPVKWRCDVFFVDSVAKLLSKQWFETLWR